MGGGTTNDFWASASHLQIAQRSSKLENWFSFHPAFCFNSCSLGLHKNDISKNLFCSLPTRTPNCNVISMQCKCNEYSICSTDLSPSSFLKTCIFISYRLALCHSCIYVKIALLIGVGSIDDKYNNEIK